MADPSDIELMRQLSRGSEEALRQVIDRHRERLYRLAYSLLGDKSAAEDVVQDTFITLWRKARRYDPRFSIAAWLCRIATNRCYDEFRRRKRHTDAIVQWNPSEKNVDVLETEEVLSLLRQVAAGLPPKQRIVYQLRELEDLSPEETAMATGMSLDQVKANLYAARNTVREKLKQYGI